MLNKHRAVRSLVRNVWIVGKEVNCCEQAITLGSGTDDGGSITKETRKTTTSRRKVTLIMMMIKE